MNELTADIQSSEQDRKPTIAERIVEIATTLSTLLIWDGEHAYCIVQSPSHVSCLPVGSKAFRRWMQSKARRMQMSPPSREAFITAEQAIEAKAEESGISPTPSIRVAGREGTGEIFIDLGDDSWNCVHVTADGWGVVPHPVDGPYLYRPPRMAALPIPERGGSIDRLWHFINVAREEDRLLLLGGIIQMLWPRGPYPPLVYRIPNG
jgi:hypothetical protein